MSEKPKHTHKFKRLKYKSGNVIFFCALPDCNTKIAIPLALGKRSICWRCGSEFIMNEYSLRLAKPHCDNCHKPKRFETIIDDSPEALVVAQNEVNKLTLSLSDRLSQTIQQANKDEGDI
jgi:hypothetical protein